MRLTNVPTYLLSRRNWNAGRERSYVILVVGVRFFETLHIFSRFDTDYDYERTDERADRIAVAYVYCAYVYFDCMLYVGEHLFVVLSPLSNTL